MSIATLWRLNGLPVDRDLAAADALVTGLQRHLRTAWLISCLVQIQDRQQAYLSLVGCAGCMSERCEPGCRVEALRRTLRAVAPSLALSAVRRGLTPRPYTRAARAIPTRQAQPLTGNILHAWADARLIVTLRPGGMIGSAPLATGAALYVGADGPDPAPLLQTHGWRSWRQRTATAPDMPSTPQARVWAWPHPPYLLLPAPMAAASEPTMPDAAQPDQERITSLQNDQELPDRGAQPGAAFGLAASLAATLDRVFVGETLFATAQPTGVPASITRTTAGTPTTALPDPPSRWPHGPGQGNGAISPAVLESLISRMLTSESPYFQPDPAPGLTLKRMNVLLGDRHNEHSRAVLLWFDAAGLLDAPADEHQRWAAPRLLLTTDHDEIATRLHAIPLPTTEALDQAKREIKK
jgi:hypothetical protein